VDDEAFLSTLNHSRAIVQHAHYESRTQRKFLTDSTLPRDAFRLRHYAGAVTYCVDGFLDKNRDLLFQVCFRVSATVGDLLLSCCV
jgi:myosin-1